MIGGKNVPVSTAGLSILGNVIFLWEAYRKSIFHSVVGSFPLATTADTATMAPLSFSLTHRAGTCLSLLANKGGLGGPNHTTAKQTWYSSFYCFMHTCNFTHLVFLIW